MARPKGNVGDDLFGTRMDGALVARLITSLPPEWNMTTPFFPANRWCSTVIPRCPHLQFPTPVFQSRYSSSGNPTAHIDSPLLGRGGYCRFAIGARLRANRNVSDLLYGSPILCRRVASRSRFTGCVSTPCSDGSTVLHSQRSHWHLPVALP